MVNKALSIIVPVYNVEKYLVQCLDSLEQQDMQDMQIICIDDCSTDSSLDILRSYQQSYSNIEVYRNDANCGLAETRNKGMEYAVGQYILFVDSDDCIEPNVIMDLYLEANKNNLDIMEFSGERFRDSEYGQNVIIGQKILESQYIASTTGVDMLCKHITDGTMSGSACLRMFKREFLIRNCLQFISGILHEDIPFVFKALLYAERVGHYNLIVYRYRIRPMSIMHSFNHGKRWIGLCIGYMNMLCTWWEYMYKFNYEEKCAGCIEEYLDRILNLMEQCETEFGLDNREKRDSFTKYIMQKNLFTKANLYDYFSTEDTKLIMEAGEITIFGAGKIAKKVISLLLRRGCCVKNIYVTSKDGNQEQIAGISIKQFNEYCANSVGDILVIAISKNNQKEAVETIRKYYVGKIVKTILQ